MFVEKEKAGLTWSFADEPSIVYPIEISACANPFCSCQVFTLAFRNPADDGSILHSLDLDIAKHCLSGAEKLGEDDALFARMLEAALSDADWLMLYIGYASVIEKHIVASDYRKLEIPDLPFDVEAIEAGSEMVLFADIFPRAHTHSAKLDEGEFIVVDQYCVKRDCHCQTAMLTFVPVVEGKGSSEHQHALYDYRSGKVEVFPPLRPGQPSPERIIGAVLASRSQLAKGLAARHSAIRAVYRRFLQNHEAAQTPAPDTSVGRNDLCPCGSGKKYKRCHGA